MFLVNFVGSFLAVRATVPVLAHHHTYCSYADTIMPQFLFAVGFAFRLTFVPQPGPATARVPPTSTRSSGTSACCSSRSSSTASDRRWEKLGQPRAAATRVVLRWAKQDLFQTLGAHRGHVALGAAGDRGPAGHARRSTRSRRALLHLALSYWFNYRWVNTPPNGVDGGPLGFLTWAIPLLVGTLAYDAYPVDPEPRASVRPASCSRARS